MKAGVLYLTEDGGSLDDSAFPYTRLEEGYELRSTLCVEGKLAGFGDLNPTVGTATYQTVEDRIHHDVKVDGTIATSTQSEVISKSTDLMYVKGQFLCTERRDPEQTLDIIKSGLQSGTVVPARIDVDSFAESAADRDPYRSGFYDRDEPVEKGISHGNHSSDDEFSGVIEEAKLNELGLENYDHDRKDLKVYVSESGFVAIRSDVMPQEFAMFIRDCVLPHARPA